jgi:ABC-type phosphate transport system ATPase subunit
MTFTIPELSLVVLIGPSGCGKSTFARKHFKPTEVMSSDGFRALVSDDENDQSSTATPLPPCISWRHGAWRVGSSPW